MKRYNVYGIGNALVDMEYEVTADELEELRIEKGKMTLVDVDHQSEVMVYLADRFTNRGSGGSAANSIIAVAQFGGSAFYSCKVADDELGDFYLQDLQRNGVDGNVHDEKEAGHTGRCLVFVTPDADRTMATYLGITGELSEQQLAPEALKASDYLYTEGYLVTSEAARALSVQARQMAEAAGVKTAFSLSDPNMVEHFKTGLLDMIGSGVDLLFANESEALGMADADSITDAIEQLKTLSRQFVITQGPKGALIWDGREMVDVPGLTVKAVDTVGAGDMFAGAYLYGLTQGWEARRAGELAIKASAELVTRFGPRMTRQQSLDVLASFS